MDDWLENDDSNLKQSLWKKYIKRRRRKNTNWKLFFLLQIEIGVDAIFVFVFRENPGDTLEVICPRLASISLCIHLKDRDKTDSVGSKSLAGLSLIQLPTVKIILTRLIEVNNSSGSSHSPEKTRVIWFERALHLCGESLNQAFFTNPAQTKLKPNETS